MLAVDGMKQVGQFFDEQRLYVDQMRLMSYEKCWEVEDVGWKSRRGRFKYCMTRWRRQTPEAGSSAIT
jgi:hypothetical protein